MNRKERRERNRVAQVKRMLVNPPRQIQAIRFDSIMNWLIYEHKTAAANKQPQAQATKGGTTTTSAGSLS